MHTLPRLLNCHTRTSGNPLPIRHTPPAKGWHPYAGPIIDPAGLDHTAVPNQRARVDILSAAAGPFDSGAGVLTNYYLGVDGGPDPHAFTHYSFDITGIVGTGGTFQLRFAEVDNQLWFNQGVDNVSILAEPIPAPGAILLAGIGAAFVAHLRRRRAL